MRKQIKIQACSSPSIEDAFKDFLLHKKATGIAEKTLRSYSQQFSAVSKFIDSSVPIDQSGSSSLWKVSMSKIVDDFC